MSNYCVYIHKWQNKWFYIGYGSLKRPHDLKHKSRSLSYWEYVSLNNINISEIEIEIIFIGSKVKCHTLEQGLINSTKLIMNLANCGTDEDIEKLYKPNKNNSQAEIKNNVFDNDITLAQYIDKRGSVPALCSFEAKILGLDTTQAKWFKTNKNMKISPLQLAQIKEAYRTSNKVNLYLAKMFT